MKKLQGKRVQEKEYHGLKELEYGKDPRDGKWYCSAPGKHFGCLDGHTVVEHEDGTISVSPSILISVPDNSGNIHELWHGYLEKGIWRSC